MLPLEPDLDRLEAFLESDQVSEGTMNLSTLDGFLTAVAIGPDLILPSEWLPSVWDGAAPAFADKEEADAIHQAIMARYDQILRDIGGDPSSCTPIYWEIDTGEEIAFDWAEGFMIGVSLRADAWLPLIGEDDHVDMLMPILALCDNEDGSPLIELDAEEENDLITAAPNIIPEMVLEIARFWKDRGLPRQPERRAGPKVGRNDACPCGSGKKYKRCCGMN